MTRFAAVVLAGAALTDRASAALYFPEDGDELRQSAKSYCAGTWDGVPLSEWSTFFVEDFSFVFANQPTCEPDVSKWNVYLATTMEGMFQNAAAFNADVNGWDVSKVTSFKNMFRGADSFDSPLDEWNVGFNENKLVDLTNFLRGARSFNTRVEGWPRFTPDTYGWNRTVIQPELDFGFEPFLVTETPAPQPEQLSAGPRYGWLAAESECYAEDGARRGCFYGTSTTNYFCFDFRSGGLVADAECEAIATKPDPVRTSCSVVDQCYRDYDANQYTACDNKCGLGYRFKKSVCTSLVNGAAVTDALCDHLPTPYLVDPIRCEGREDCTGRYWKETVDRRRPVYDPRTCMNVNGQCYVRETSVCKYEDLNGEVRIVEPEIVITYQGERYSYSANRYFPDIIRELVMNSEYFKYCKNIPSPTMVNWEAADKDSRGFRKGSLGWAYARCCETIGFEEATPLTGGSGGR